mgnify:CR=1 FL=1
MDLRLVSEYAPRGDQPRAIDGLVRAALQAGMAVAVVLRLALGFEAGLLYLVAYSVMKGGAFLVVAGAQARGIPDDMDAYRGLSRRMPFLAGAMTIFLLSLAGIPPLAGYYSKDEILHMSYVGLPAPPLEALMPARGQPPLHSTPPRSVGAGLDRAGGHGRGLCGAARSRPSMVGEPGRQQQLPWILRSSSGM